MIWKYDNLAQNIKSDFRLTLNEGDTEFEQIMINDRKVWLKREDLNPNKSFKDRSLAYQISKYIQEGQRKFTISSSGNAAASAAAYINLASEKYSDVRLVVFVKNDIPDYKLENIHVSDNDRVQKCDRPKSEALKLAREKGYLNLRGSVDDNALIGFKTLGYEIAEFGESFDAIFICCSSGTSTIGIFEGIRKLGEVPSIHVVQTSKIHPIAKEFDLDFEESDSSLANAIADRVSKRKNKVVNIIRETDGYGWVVSDDDLKNAKMIAQNSGLDVIGYNAYVGLAGYLKAVRSGREFENPLVLVSGV